MYISQSIQRPTVVMYTSSLLVGRRQGWGDLREEHRRAHYLSPCCSAAKESACDAGDPGLIPGSERPSGERMGYPLQCSGLEKSMDRGAWWATAHGVAKTQI